MKMNVWTRRTLAALVLIVVLVWVVAIDAATGHAPGCCTPQPHPLPMEVK